jgi:hypothetical protein
MEPAWKHNENNTSSCHLEGNVQVQETGHLSQVQMAILAVALDVAIADGASSA